MEYASESLFNRLILVNQTIFSLSLDKLELKNVNFTGVSTIFNGRNYTFIHQNVNCLETSADGISFDESRTLEKCQFNDKHNPGEQDDHDHIEDNDDDNIDEISGVVQTIFCIFNIIFGLSLNLLLA